jgi:hypothetical protein
MTDYPTTTESGYIWLKADTLNQIAEAGNQRTRTVASEWRGVLVLTERKDSLEIRIDLNVLLQKYGQQVFFVRDGVAVSAPMLLGEVTAV